MSLKRRYASARIRAIHIAEDSNTHSNNLKAQLLPDLLNSEIPAQREDKLRQTPRYDLSSFNSTRPGG
jgi:hypothetical protein